MAESATVNLIKYLDQTSDVSSKSKSYMDKSSNDFSDIFNNVNKSYSSDEKQAQAVIDKPVKQNSKPSEENKSENIASQNTNSDTSEVENKNVKEERVEKDSEENPQGNPQKDSKKEASDDEEKAIVESDKNTSTENSTKEKTSAETETQKNAVAEKFNATMDEINIANDLNKIHVEYTSVPAAEVAAEPEAPVIKQEPETKESTSEMNTTDIINTGVNIPVPTENVIDALALNAQNPDSSVNVSNKENISQVVQNQNTNFLKALGNTNVAQNSQDTKILQEPAKTNPQGEANIQQPAIAQDTVVVNQEQETEIPVIEVATDAMAEDVDVSKNNQNAKNVLNKTGLNQEALDKLNAKVVNVENSKSSTDFNSNTNTNSNSNQTLGESISNTASNTISRQNTQDQVVKLSLETVSVNKAEVAASESINTVIDTTNQLNLAKTPDNILAQQTAQPQAQQSRQISDIEIISQINNKLNALKDEAMSKISIVLRPENLGKVNLELVSTKEGLTAQMTTDNPQVKEILDKSLNSLRENLSNQGVNVSNVTVKIEEPQKQQNNQNMFEYKEDQQQPDNQQASNNSQKQDWEQNSKDLSFEEGGENIASANNGEEYVQSSETTVSIGAKQGKVDYKV